MTDAFTKLTEQILNPSRTVGDGGLAPWGPDLLAALQRIARAHELQAAIAARGAVFHQPGTEAYRRLGEFIQKRVSKLCEGTE